MSGRPAPDGDRDERLLSGYTGRLAVLLAVGWLTILLGRQTLPPLLPTIIDAFAISPTHAGVVLTLLMGGYGLLQYPAGRLSDARSRTAVLRGSIAGMLVGFGLLATVASYAQLLLGAAVLGTSAAFYFTPSRAFLSDLFVVRRGQALGMQSTAGLVGSALAAGVAVGAVHLGAWQLAFLPSIAILAVVGLLLPRFSEEAPAGEAVPDFALRGTLGRLLGTAEFRRLLAMRALVAFSFQALVGFLPAYLRFGKGLSTAAAGGVFAAFFVVGAATTPISGWLSDRLPRLRVVGGGIAVAILGLAGLLLAGDLPGVLVGTVVLAAGLLSLVPVVQAYLLDSFPEGSAGGDYGAAKAIFTGMGSLGPTYLGVLVVGVGYTLAFASLGPLLALAGLLVLAVRAG